MTRWLKITNRTRRSLGLRHGPIWGSNPPSQPAPQLRRDSKSRISGPRHISIWANGDCLSWGQVGMVLPRGDERCRFPGVTARLRQLARLNQVRMRGEMSRPRPKKGGNRAYSRAASRPIGGIACQTTAVRADADFDFDAAQRARASGSLCIASLGVIS